MYTLVLCSDRKQKLFMRWSIVGLSSCGCRQVLSFGGVGSDDIEADEKRSSEINGEGCLAHPSSRKQADTSLKKKSPFRSQAKTKYLSKFNRVETLQMDEWDRSRDTLTSNYVKHNNLRSWNKHVHWILRLHSCVLKTLAIS